MIKKQKVSLNTVRSVQFKRILKLEAKDPRDNFFDCSPKELIGEREFEYNKNTKKFGFHLKDENTQFSSSCVKQAIREGFTHSEKTIKDFADLFKAKDMATALVSVVKTLSQTQSHYPSPFLVRNFKSRAKSITVDQILSSPQMMGKPDDITVVAGLIVDKTASPQETKESLENFQIDVKQNRSQMYTDLQDDIIHFYKKADVKQFIESIGSALLPIKRNKIYI